MTHSFELVSINYNGQNVWQSSADTLNKKLFAIVLKYLYMLFLNSCVFFYENYIQNLLN